MFVEIFIVLNVKELKCTKLVIFLIYTQDNIFYSQYLSVCNIFELLSVIVIKKKEGKCVKKNQRVQKYFWCIEALNVYGIQTSWKINIKHLHSSHNFLQLLFYTFASDFLKIHLHLSLGVSTKHTLLLHVFLIVTTLSHIVHTVL